MKKLISLILIAMLCLPLAIFAGCDKPSETIRVMSFNIRNSLAIEDNSLDNWDSRKERVPDVIEKYAPDILGMQEVIINQYEYLQEQLKGYGSYAVDRTGTVFGERCAIFYKLSRFELIESGTFWLSETPEEVSIGWDASTYRICSYVKLKDKNTGKEIWYYNTHFDHIGQTAREESAALILERIAGQANVILGGDFNTHEDNPAYIALTAVLGNSKYLAPEGSSDSGGTTTDFETISGETPIDHILLTTDNFTVEKYAIVRDTYDGRYPSDHCPIYSDIKVN